MSSSSNVDAPTWTVDTLNVNSQANLYENTQVTGTLAIGESTNELTANLNVYGTTTLVGYVSIQANTGPMNGQPGDLTIAGTLTLGTSGAINAFSSNTGLSPADNQTVPTQLAVKTYVDGQVTALNQAIGQKADLGGSASQPFAAQQLTCSGLTSGVVSENAGVSATLAGNGELLAIRGSQCAFISWYLEGVTALPTNSVAYLGFPVDVPQFSKPDLYIRNQVSTWDEQGNGIPGDASVLILKGDSSRVSLLNLQIDDQNTSVNEFGHLDPNANGYQYGNLSFLGRPMIMFNESYNTYPAGAIVGALGFYGPAPTGSTYPNGVPFYGSHGQFHYRSGYGFECLDVSADRPSIEHPSTEQGSLSYAWLTAIVHDVSSKAFKKDIQTIDDEQLAALLVATLETPLATFRFLQDSDAVDPHLGVIAETCPGYILGQDGKSVRVTAYTAMLHGALKVLARRLAAVEACLLGGADSSSQSA